MLALGYKETMAYLYARLPMFTRDGSSAINKGLGRTMALCEALGNPHEKLSFIHVAGTNGKGSTSHMLASVLAAAGYKTGLYTSPHLLDFRERIRVNGEMISPAYVVDFIAQHRDLIEHIQPSFFEVTVALCFAYFAEQEVDYAIIEVGLGGRLDSTNIINPILSIITNIGLDHMDMLGNTLVQIAGEKAGIIKKNTPVVVSEYQEEVAEVFQLAAAKSNASIVFAEDEWQVVQREHVDGHLVISVEHKTEPSATATYRLDLTGWYQQKNLLGVLSAVRRLCQLGLDIPKKTVQLALQYTQDWTGLQGRWYTLSKNPYIICDTGHNEAGIREVVLNLRQTTHVNLRMVFGAMRDKDLSRVLPLLPKQATYYFCAPDMPRAMDPTVLKEKASEYQLHGCAYTTVSDALRTAIADYQDGDLIFVGGSTFVVADVMGALKSVFNVDTLNS